MLPRHVPSWRQSPEDVQTLPSLAQCDGWTGHAVTASQYSPKASLQVPGAGQVAAVSHDCDGLVLHLLSSGMKVHAHSASPGWQIVSQPGGSKCPAPTAGGTHTGAVILQDGAPPPTQACGMKLPQVASLNPSQVCGDVGLQDWWPTPWHVSSGAATQLCPTVPPQVLCSMTQVW